jgi:protein-disulfide isomerase
MKSWKFGLIVTGLAAFLWGTFPALAQQSFSPEQREQIEKIVRDYLLEHPEIMIEVMSKLEQRQEAEAAAKRQQALIRNKAALFSSADDFVVNADGNVPMVEFFDYQCGYCKRVMNSVMKVSTDHTDVRVAFKEYPILGPVSVFASKASIASRRQGKYLEFHTAVMGHSGRLSEKIILKKAAEVGLDVEQLKTDMADKEVQAVIDRNLALGRTMEIRGTPTLIIGDNLVPGAIPYERMVELIGKTRESCAIC